MKLAVSTLSFRHLPLERALRQLAGLGIRYVELCVDSHHSESERWNRPPEEMLVLIQKLGLALNSIHIPLVEGGRQVSQEELRDLSLEKSRKAIDLARFLSANMVIQHVMLADAPGENRAGNLELFIPDLRKVVGYADTQGIKLALENVPAKNGMATLGNDPHQVMDAVDALASGTVGICLDVSHCVASGYNPVEVLGNLNIKNLLSLHISDNIYDLRGDWHLPVGAGQIDWENLFAQLRARGFAGSIVVEVAGDSSGEENLQASLAYLGRFRGCFSAFPG